MRRRQTRAFTLIEVLVVVAIIGLLVSILLPSLHRAREQGRTLVCQTNVRQLTMAFLSYSTQAQGLLPGCSEDPGADWLGGANTQQGHTGRQPEDGVIYKHLGNQKNVYACPADDAPRNFVGTLYSYTASTLMSGANTALVSGSHYRYSGAASVKNYSDTDHSADMRPNGAMVVIEEDPVWYLTNVINSAWDADDGVATRHMGKYGSVGFIDGHVSRVNLPATPHVTGKYFRNNSQCVKIGSKWVAGKSWSDFTYDASRNPRGAYRMLERAAPAKDYGVKHVQ